MDQLPPFKYPIWVISTEPVPNDSDGHPDPTNVQLFVTADNYGTPLLQIFRTFKLIETCFGDRQLDWKPYPVEIRNEEQFHWIRKLLCRRYNRPIGANVDPDANLRGFPLPPSNWPDIEAN